MTDEQFKLMRTQLVAEAALRGIDFIGSSMDARFVQRHFEEKTAEAYSKHVEMLNRSIP